MIITAEGYDPADDPPGVPLIGYQNLVTAVTATSETDDGPASNLLLPATHLFWEADSADAQTLGITTSGETNYLAIAKHNLVDSGARFALAHSNNSDATSGYLSILMHFEGTNGGVDYFDTSGNDVAFTNVTTGVLSTAQFKFGTMSLSLAGTGYIWASGAWFAFGSNDFTIDLWVRITATGSQYYIFDTGDTTTGMSIRKTAGDVLVFKTGNVDQITGATALTTGTWHHVAVARSGTSTKLFLNGVQQGSTYSDSNMYTSTDEARFGASQAAANQFNGFFDELRVLNGRAFWTAAFTAPTSAYSDGLTATIGNYSALWHFDGTDASTTITDDSGSDHVFTAQGNAQLDTAQFKFGTASVLFDGTGDYLQGDGSEDFAFGTDDFTVDFWLRLNATGNQQALWGGEPLGSFGGTNFIYLFISTGNVLIYFHNFGSAITGTTVLTTGVWYHVAMTKSSGNVRLFLDGVQEGSTYNDTTGDYLAFTDRPLIGIRGASAASDPLNGWIDELRVVKGTAFWTRKFAVPKRAAGSSAVLGRSIGVEDAAPLVLRYTPTTDGLALHITAGGEAAQLSVIYAGELLVLERSIKWDVGHFNVVHARRSTVLAGMSESGQFLGRILTGEWRESQAEFAWFTPDWYRTNFEPFAEAAMTQPFFWIWNPDEYPDETAFAWLIDDIRPETDPATRRVAATISMRAIA